MIEVGLFPGIVFGVEYYEDYVDRCIIIDLFFIRAVITL